ncbi:MAG: hypothetical protein A2603_17025 [Bdellovibrionales bacterium RIFOXYD1_FULL_55_31]|nr:MAG: hypothetical protein A2603_17025 [Bdellovibrionales bacterium RIFOXYD1_FULL_55_31]
MLFDRLNQRSGRTRYGLALLLIGLAHGVNAFLMRFQQGPYLLIPLGAIVLSGLLGGRGPGLLALALGVLGIDFLYAPGAGAIAGMGREFALAVFIFGAAGALWLDGRLLDASAEMRNSQSRLQDLADWIEQVMIWEIDAKTLQCTFISRGAEGLLKFPIRKWIEEPGFLLKHVHTDDRTQFQSAMRSVLASSLPVSLEHRVVDADRATHWCQSTFRSVRRGSVTLIRGLTIQIERIRDAEQKAQLVEESLKRTVRLREDVLAVVSHDLRNPLSSIMMSAGLLQKGVSPGVLADSIRNSVNRMNQVIEGLLEWAKLESKGAKEEQRPFDAAGVIGEVIESFKSLADQKNVRVERDVPAYAISVDCDREQFFRVLFNLMSNAVRFSAERGSVVVALSQQENEVLVSVRDTGPGIQEEELRHIFDRNWQANKPRSTGAGLGLAIAKGIVEANGGRIWVESQVNRGSTFFFTIPREGRRLPGREAGGETAA